MFDIQLIRLLDVLDVSKVEEAAGVTPRSLILTGPGFANVETVLLNGVPSPQIIHYAPNKILAQVPDSIIGQPITEVFVLSSNLTFTDKSLVEFTFGTSPKKVNGVLRLMQTFLRMMLRTPGTNVFHKRLGGGLGQLIGSTFDASNGRSLATSQASIAVTRARQQIINTQSVDRNIPPNERLLSADISALALDQANGALQMTIILTSHAGRTAAASLVL